MKFTVLGGSGFIGGNMARHLKATGHDVNVSARGASLSGNLGHVIYAIGVVGGAKERAADMIEAHAAMVHRLLSTQDFESFLYLSSTRPYGALPPGAAAVESAALPVVPSGFAVFDVSKLLGESVCLSFDNPAVRIARLSNIYGHGQSVRTFLGSIVRDLKEKGAVTIGESPQSSKDYLSIDDAVRIMEKIALGGRERVYNVASGTITTHADIAAVFGGLGYKVSFAEHGPTRAFPRIDVTKIKNEFGITCRTLADDLPALVQDGVVSQTSRQSAQRP
jgi:nucleoside-diphosphate-sugar epimerase